VDSRALRHSLERAQATAQRHRRDLERGPDPALLEHLERSRAALAAAEQARDQAQAHLFAAQQNHQTAALALATTQNRLRRREQQQVAASALVVVALVVTLGLALGVQKPPPALIWAGSFVAATTFTLWLGMRGRPRLDGGDGTLSGYAGGALASAISLGLAGWGAPLQLRGAEGPLVMPWTSWPCAVVVVTSWVLAREPLHRARAGMVMAQIFSMIALGLLALSAWARVPFVRPAQVVVSLQALVVAVVFALTAQRGILDRSVQRPLELAEAGVRKRFLIALGVAGLFVGACELVGFCALGLIDVLIEIGLRPRWYHYAETWHLLSALALLVISPVTSWWFARGAPHLPAHLRWAPLVLSLVTALGLFAMWALPVAQRSIAN
jgi:hypothetical protein